MKLTDLRKNLGGGRQNKYPSKTAINMAACGKERATGKTLAIGVALIIILVVLVVKFCVYDQYARLDRAESAYSSIEQQNQELLDKVGDYDDILLEYRAYSMNFVSDSEDESYVSVDRKEVLDLIESRMMNRGDVLSIEIYGGTAKVSMDGMNLEEISRMISNLKQSPIVSGAQLNIAQTEENKSASVLSFSVTIYLQQEEEAAQ